MTAPHERIKERRSACGLTLLEVAEKLGVKEATAQRYESGEIKNIRHETIMSLSKIFRCSPSYLMGWTNLMNEPHHDLEIKKEPAKDDGQAQGVTNEHLDWAKRIMALPEDDRERVLDYIHLLGKR